MMMFMVAKELLGLPALPVTVKGIREGWGVFLAVLLR